MKNVYQAREKKPGFWYVEGPGWGEPGDKFCATKESAEVSASRMSFAYNCGISEYRSKVANKLNELFDLGLGIEIC